MSEAKSPLASALAVIAKQNEAAAKAAKVAVKPAVDAGVKLSRAILGVKESPKPAAKPAAKPVVKPVAVKPVVKPAVKPAKSAVKPAKSAVKSAVKSKRYDDMMLAYAGSNCALVTVPKRTGVTMGVWCAIDALGGIKWLLAQKRGTAHRVIYDAMLKSGIPDDTFSGITIAVQSYKYRLWHTRKAA